MFKKILFFSILLGITQLMAFDKYDTAMGLHFGNSTGNGYSLRQWNNAFSYQLTFGAYTTDNGDPNFSNYTSYPRTHGRRTISMGMNYIAPLLETSGHNFYFLIGGAYTYRDIRRYTSADQGTWKRSDKWTLGIGPGFEFAFSERFHMSVEVPITLNNKGDITMTVPAGGIYYYFK